MKLLIFGKNGQLGWELQRALAPLGEIISVDSDSTDYCGNFLDPAGVAETVRQVKPDVIFNASAHTAVDKAESERDLALLINATSVESIATEADKLGAWLVHYSTDYVFDGSGERPWCENDQVGPLNVYGETKLLGEQAAARCSRHLIFRTSWVYSSRGNNFIKTMLKLGQQREQLSVIDDQIGAPTGAELLADCSAHAIRIAFAKPELAGLYHLVAKGATSWFEFAEFIFSQANESGVTLALKHLEPVPTSSYPTAATRPHNSRLNTSKFEEAFNLTLPSWQHGVKRMIAEILPLHIQNS
ncbi:dTDP-4-dehydrorhamnose reductase [Motilimonas sp. KMU-193]|uniref:dTDP-4-dehydrorhamnose reductase n=1 Tax=Motilimonas sp. KMU-193 TaxID=3388668 RepID=UPI00396B4813